MWVEKWDEVAQVPYMYKGERWVSYDNQKSVAIKVRHKLFNTESQTKEYKLMMLHPCLLLGSLRV
jgi:hypothetical protein